jgi:hypothetical protein
MKTCSNPKCAQANPQNLDSFHKDKSKKDGFRTRCKSCVAPLKANWNKENPERKAARNKRWVANNPGRYKELQLKRKFGITLDIYNQILANQNSCCAICNTHRSKLRRDLAVDHCHSTGKIRGLLCDHCNSGLGHFKDNVNFLAKAITYLGE